VLRTPDDGRTGSRLALARALASRSDRPRSAWATDIALAGLVGVLILYSIDLGLTRQAAGQSSAGAAAIFGLAVLLNHAMNHLLDRRALEAMAGLIGDVTGQVLDAALATDLQTVETLGPARILRMTTDDAAELVPAASLLIQAAVGSVTVITSIVYVGALSAPAAVLCLALMLALIGISQANTRSIEKQVQADRAARDALDGLLDDLLTGFKQVSQHAGRSQDLASAFDKRSRDLLRSRRQHFASYFYLDSIRRQAFLVLLGIVSFGLPLVVPEVANETSRLVVAVVFILTPLILTVLAFDRLTRAADTWCSLLAMRDHLRARAAHDGDESRAPSPFTGLELDGVTFRHEDTPERPGSGVGPLDLSLRPGEIVFVTGANGSGKSTFIKLLCGLYRRSGGEARLGGRSMPAALGSAWHGCFSTVLAEFALFERLYGHDGIDPARVDGLLAEMELEHAVRFTDGRFDTVDLSTGQRKRLALVVALLQDRPVYVFDEWASDQDPRFRTRFYRHILPMLKAQDKAVVAVTHDDDAFDACDRRIHLVNGRIETP